MFNRSPINILYQLEQQENKKTKKNDKIKLLKGLNDEIQLHLSGMLLF